MTFTGPERCRLAVVAANLANEQSPFDSPAGRLFQATMTEVGIGVEKVAFGWASEQTPAELDQLGAEFVILAGEDALHLFRDDLHVRGCHGRPMLLTPDSSTADGPIAFPMFHPEAFHRNPRWRPLLQAELLTLKDIARDRTDWVANTPLSCVRCRGLVHRIDDQAVVFCEDHWNNPPQDRPLTLEEVATMFGTQP